MYPYPALMQAIILDPSILSLLVLVTCLACIYMVFFFGRRLQNSAYLRDSLIEGATQQELKVLLRELDDRALQGPLDPKSPPPVGYGSTRRLWRSDEYAANSPTPGYWSGSKETDEEKQARIDREAQQKLSDEACSKWEMEEKVRYEAEKEKDERIAAQRAQNKVPTSFDISLLGGGYAFLLEFSTVIVIIFTLLILGILKIMEGKDISTILAAIAGYVLGKATSESKKGSSPVSDPIKMMENKPRP